MLQSLCTSAVWFMGSFSKQSDAESFSSAQTSSTSHFSDVEDDQEGEGERYLF